MEKTTTPTRTTQAFFIQAAISFGVAMLGLAWAVLYLTSPRGPAPSWG